jgi:hypothetical protein
MSSGATSPGTDERAALESLLAKSAGTDVPVLLQAKEMAKKLVKSDPSSANRAALQRATTMLENAMSNNDGPKFFKNVGEVLSYLHDCHRQIEKSKLYEDIRQGAIKKTGGQFKQRDVDKYAASLPLSTTPDGKVKAVEDRQRRKDEAEIRIKEAQAIREEKKNAIIDEQYIARDQVYQEFASRAVALNAGLKSAVMAGALEMVTSVGGDPQKTDVLNREMEKLIDAATSEFSRELEFEVELHGFDDGEDTGEQPQ